MSKTIEQRWKDVGVEREKIASFIRATSDRLPLYQADALLPLIEKAVREGRKDEMRLWREHNDTYEGTCGVHMPRLCLRCQREAELEAGNE